MNQYLAQAIVGDKSAEDQLFQYLFVRFRFFAKRITQIDEEAEDLAQEACMTVLKKYKTVTFDEGFEAWAYGVLRMKIGNYLQSKATRNKRVVSEHIIDEMREPSPPIDHDLRKRLIECLRKIVKVNRRYARLLNLTYQGYKTDEICAKLKLNRNNLYVTLNRGRAMLRACLETGEV